MARLELLEPRTLLSASGTDWIDGSGPSSLKNIAPLLASETRMPDAAAMAPGSGVLAIYVEAGLRPSIQAALDVYLADLAADGYQPSVQDFSGTAAELRADLYTRWSTASLEGALFVGDLPYVAFTSEDNWDSSPVQVTYAHDLYFMDLDGTYVLNATGLDEHTAGSGDVGPEIYVSRITTGNLAGVTGRNEATLINQYFARVHAYRHGELKYQNRGIVFADDDWSGWGVAEMDDLYSEVLAVNSTAVTNKATYLNTLPLNYESTLECIHSSITYHALKVGTGWEYITNTEVAAANPRQAFYNMFNCSSAAFNVANNLIGTYVYSGDYGLGAVGSAKTGSMLYFSDYYAPQGAGKSVGEAFRTWFDVYAHGTNETSYDWMVDWFYGMTMQGDPTLKPARMPYGATVTPTSGLTAGETGGTATFTVVMDSPLTANVTISLSSSDVTEGVVWPSNLLFTSANWSMPQTVTVTGVDDLVDDGDVAYTIITAAAVSTDTRWNGLDAPDVTVTNLDNDTAAVVVTPTSGLVTSEGGGSATFTLALATQPEGTYVNISLASDDVSEGTVSASAVHFDRNTWNLPQTVTVTGVADSVADGDQSYHVITGAAVSDAADYSGRSVADVTVLSLDTDLAQVIVTPTAGLITTESGGTATFSVRLATQPSANANIALASNDPTEGTPSLSSLTFTAANWSVPQTVTITGVDDADQDGDVSYAIRSGACTSTDAHYNNLAVDDVATINLDDDRMEIRRDPAATLVTDENGAEDTFRVWLGSRPSASVRIDFQLSDPTEGRLAPASAAFTPSAWNMPQTVTLAGVDDLIDDGSVPYTITGMASSLDPGYNGMVMPSLQAANHDNGDTAGVTASPTSGLVTTETGGTATFAVSLDSEPTADVTIELSSSDPEEGSVFPPSLTFTAASWAMPQTVTVTGVDDGIDDGDAPYTILTTATSGDTSYNNLAVDDVSVTNRGRRSSNLDADGNGRADALTDGILVLRYLFDPAGQWNFSDALGSGATRTTRQDLRTFLDGGRSTVLDADGNGTADALTDGILVLRYLFDPPGQWNFSDALGSGATRTTRTAIRAYLDQNNPGAPSAPGLTADTPVDAPAAQVQTASMFDDAATMPAQTVAGPSLAVVAAFRATVVTTSDDLPAAGLARPACGHETAGTVEVRAVDAILQQWKRPRGQDVVVLRPVGWTNSGRSEDPLWAADRPDGEDGLDWFLAHLDEDVVAPHLTGA